MDRGSLFCKTKPKPSVSWLLYSFGGPFEPKGAWFYSLFQGVAHWAFIVLCQWACFVVSRPHCRFFRSLCSCSIVSQLVRSFPVRKKLHLHPLVFPGTARTEIFPLLAWLFSQYIGLGWIGLKSFSKRCFLLTWLIFFLSYLISKTSCLPFRT